MGPRLVKLLGLPGILVNKFPIAWGAPQVKSLGGGMSNFGDSSSTPNILDDAILQGNDNFTWIRASTRSVSAVSCGATVTTI